MIATRPAVPLETGAARASRKVPSYVVGLLLLVCAGALMQVGWVMVWTLSYHLTHGNDFTWTYLTSQAPVWERLIDWLVLANTLAPGLASGPNLEAIDFPLLVNALALAFLVVAVGYVCAIMLVDLGISALRGAFLVVIAFEVIFQITLFVMPGLYTTDIFSYVMYGHISAVYNLNPYIYPPNYFPANPLLDWIHPIWHDQPSVYGPLWTWIGWLMARAMAPFDGLVQNLPDGTVLQIGLMDQVFGYKLLMNGVQVVNLGLVWWLLGRVMAGQASGSAGRFRHVCLEPAAAVRRRRQRAQRRAHGHPAAAGCHSARAAAPPINKRSLVVRHVLYWTECPDQVHHWSRGLVLHRALGKAVAIVACPPALDRRQRRSGARRVGRAVHPLARFSARLRANADCRGWQVLDVQQLGAGPDCTDDLRPGS